MLKNLPRKTSLTILTFGLFAVAIVFVSRWMEPKPVALKPPPPPVKKDAIPFLDVPDGSLDTFFASLRRTEAREPGAVTRILHYGDSPTTADSITADVRKLLQIRFGDAGHGFVLIAKPWAWYGHRGIKLSGSGWQIQPASQARAKDGIHGLGGVSFTGEPGATSSITLPDDKYSRAIVYYLAQPEGGAFTLSAAPDEGEDEKIEEVQTAGEQKQPGFEEVALPPGTRTVNLRVTSGPVRLFGYRFDKDQPGVQYNSLGINGAQVQMVLRSFETNQWTANLRHENPALVVLNYGTNESIYPRYVEKEYPDELRRVVATIRKALPNASLLLMGPMDRGVANAGGEVSTAPTLEDLIAVQKRVAAENGCAFFNTFEAMGGVGTMARWYAQRPQLVSADYTHPMPGGAAIVGQLFEQALMQAYGQRSPRQ